MESHPESGQSSQTAVLLVNLGTPRAPTRAAVAAFLAEFLSDQRVVELPAFAWQPLLRGVVIPLRARRVAHAYATIWDGDSPLRAILRASARGLRASCARAVGTAPPRCTSR